MTVHRVVEHEALADYSLLMSEAAVVLSALAAAETPGERIEELADLHAIHAEGADFRAVTPLAVCVQRMFGRLIALGESLAAAPVVSSQALARAHAWQRLAQALAAALDDPSPSSPGLEHVNQELRALDPALTCALELRAAACAAADLLDAERV
jgi:hypothetical protein